jgi:hypothetical protein
MASVEGVSEVEVLNLYRVASSGYPREEIPMLTDGGKRGTSSILYSTYATLVVSISLTPYGPGSGVLLAPPEPSLYLTL